MCTSILTYWWAEVHTLVALHLCRVRTTFEEAPLKEHLQQLPVGERSLARECLVAMLYSHTSELGMSEKHKLRAK